MTDLAPLLSRIERLLDRLETSAASAAPDWNTVHAARWSALSAELKPIIHAQATALDSLIAIDAQKARVDANTRQFVEGRPANNVLLTGARGCGKSSLVKAVHARYAPAGLRLIEVDKAGLPRLPDLFELLAESTHASSSSSTTSALPNTSRATRASKPRSTARSRDPATTC